MMRMLVYFTKLYLKIHSSTLTYCARATPGRVLAKCLPSGAKEHKPEVFAYPRLLIRASFLVLNLIELH
jgi:hypothetical protein